MIKETFDRVLAKAVERADGWVNALTGIGHAARDKSRWTRMSVDLLDRQTLEDIWRGDDMAARIIETVPNEMCREWLTIKIQDDSEAAELLCAKLDDLCVQAKVQEALEYERAYGGAAILIGANDGAADLRMPLNEDGIKTLDWLTVMAAHELYPSRYYTDPQAPKFGEPMIYQLMPDNIDGENFARAYVQVHESRLLRFSGIKVSRRQVRINNGWGDSVLVRCNRILSQFDQTWGSAGILMQDFAQAVLKVNGLAELIATNNDDVVVKRAQALDMSRSVARMFIIDSEEDFERKATPMTGMPEMLEKFALRLSAAADMPISLLMGQAPAGLNATGASDIRFFYDRVRARQHNALKPKLSRLVRLLMRTRGSATAGIEPENWSINFNPLWQSSGKEQAEERKLQAETDQIYVNIQAVTPNEIAASRFGGDAWSPDTVVDLDARKAMLNAKPEPQEEDGADDKPA